LINFVFKEISKIFRSYFRVWHLFCDFFAPKQANFHHFLVFADSSRLLYDSLLPEREELIEVKAKGGKDHLCAYS
jgi:hypothetical protein